MFVLLQIFEMMDAKARQDCVKEIDLLKVKLIHHIIITVACSMPFHSDYIWMHISVGTVVDWLCIDCQTCCILGWISDNNSLFPVSPL